MNKDLIENTIAEKQQYESLVVTLIRKKYSLNDEQAIIRKKLAGIDSKEFEEYNKYAEECKTIAKNFVNERAEAFISYKNARKE